ncbi:MAG: HAMP domain-containing histidine kinase [Phycisphaerales bacterium]|nr:HAMP domain-containing histidine kinase [Phycisphaerales bacterium]
MNSRAPNLRIFWLCAIAVLGVLVWITLHTLRLEKREVVSQAAYARQEAIRLALWRMDSALTPVIAREASRPYFHYQSFYPTERAFTRMLEEVNPGDVMVPSPLLDAPIGVIRLYFQVSDTGSVTSPQVPQADLRKLAEDRYISTTALAAAEDHLTQLGALRAAAEKGLLASKQMYKDDAAALASAPPPGADPWPTPPPPQQVASDLSYRQQQSVDLKKEFAQRFERQNLARTAEQAPENQVANRAYVAEQARRGEGADSEAGKLGDDVEVADRGDADSVETKTAEPAPTAAAAAAAPNPAASTPTPAAPSEAAESATRRQREQVRDRGDQPAKPADEAGRELHEAPAEPESVDEVLRKDAQLRTGDASDKNVSDARASLVLKSGNESDSLRMSKSAGQTVQTAAPVSMTDLTPSWIGPPTAPQLVFTRHVTVGGDTFEQGFWLDWQLTRSWLLSDIGDLFQWADLQPVLEDVRGRPTEALGRTLASIPAELVVSEPLALTEVGWTPMRLGLVVSWLAVLAALAITWGVLRALHDLAERRGRFAAAVTHELRTPLTTFCLYSQMLAEGMVPEERKSEYLGTMKSESGRLAGIVESVLEYARLGRAPHGGSVQQVELHGLLDPIAGKLRETASTHGFELRAELHAAHGVIVKADPMGVERVLTNLVDNACKYARGHSPEAIDVAVSIGRRYASITVRDHGRGLTPEEEDRMFEPYFRGARTTDLGVPGVGLGLALAQGVARSMGGDLRFSRPEGGSGAAFTLTLAIAS